MFQWLGKFEKILVTGPQRSGTRICARMIAYDTGYQYIDEIEIGVDSLNWFWSFFSKNRYFVVQCPALCRYVHMFSADDTGVVLMLRKIDDIITSQERIDWNSERIELARYDSSEGIIADIKYKFWKENQVKHIKHTFEIEYESLVGHPLWVPNHLRLNFSFNQTACQNGDFSMLKNALPCPHSDILYQEEPGHRLATLIKMKRPAKLLNTTGRIIWTLCDGTHTIQDILLALKVHFDGVEDDILKNDLIAFINELVDQGFLQLTSIESPVCHCPLPHRSESNPELGS